MLIRVNSVPVLSKAIFFVFFIFSKMLLFFTNTPLLVARLRIIAMTLGTASPRAQGHEATKTPIPLSTTQHTSHILTLTYPKNKRSDQTRMVIRLRIITPFTNKFEIVLQTAWIPLSSLCS